MLPTLTLTNAKLGKKKSHPPLRPHFYFAQVVNFINSKAAETD